MLIYSMSTSLDGFITDRKARFEWTAPVVLAGATPFLPIGPWPGRRLRRRRQRQSHNRTLSGTPAASEA
jgi:hypothetical protein